MSLKESIEKLMEGDDKDDLEIAALLLESDNFSVEEKMEYIEKFINQNPQEFTEKEKRFIKLWLDSKKENNNQSIQKLKLWILKNH